MAARRAGLPASSFNDFGSLLRVLRLRARLTQRQLGMAVGYSEAQISRLEQGKRAPDPAAVAALFLPSLALSDEPGIATRLHELALAARGRGPDGRGPDGWGLDGRGLDGRGLAGRGPDGDAPWRDDGLTGIPPPPAPEVARPAVQAQLRDRLTAQRCVLLWGPPGVGKTILAATVARERADKAAVCWLTITSGITTSAEALVRRLARFLAAHGQRELTPLCEPGQVEQPLPRDEQTHLIAAGLSRVRAVVCLDNVHLLDGEPDALALAEHLAATSRAQFLAISREGLPMAGFDPFRLGGFAPDQARTLIAGLSGARLSAAVTTRLVERTEGSPMLIRLALGQAHPDPRELVEHLEAQPGVSEYLLRSTLAGLGEPSRRLISLLAVFRHPVDLLDERLIEASESLDGPFDVAGGIGELRRRQLVDDPTRARLHPLVHDHVYAWLIGATAGRRRLHALAAAYCEQALDDPLEASWHYARAGDLAEAADLLAARAADLTVRGQSERAADLAADLLAARGAGEGEGARQLLVARGDLLVHTERAAEAEDAYRDALARQAAPAVRAGVAWRLAQCLLQRGKVSEALELCRGTVASLGGGEDVLRAQLIAVQSQAHLMLSEFDAAAAVAAEACATADRVAAITPDVAVSVQARAYSVLGITARMRGQLEDAADWLAKSLAAARAAGLRQQVGRALFNLAAIAQERGDFGRAEGLYDEALAQSQPIGDAYGTARALHALAMIRHHRGEQDKAIALLEESIALRRRIGDPAGAANSEHSLSLVLLSAGQVRQARDMLTRVVEAAADLGERRSLAHYLDSMAMIALVARDLAAASLHLARSAEIAGAIGEPSLLADIARHQVISRLAADDAAAARRLAARLADDAGTLAHMEHLAVTACVALASGDADAAIARAAELEQSARAAGCTLEEGIAARITVAAGAQAGPPPPESYPRLIWVAGPD